MKKLFVIIFAFIAITEKTFAEPGDKPLGPAPTKASETPSEFREGVDNGTIVLNVSKDEFNAYGVATINTALGIKTVTDAWVKAKYLEAKTCYMQDSLPIGTPNTVARKGKIADDTLKVGEKALILCFFLSDKDQQQLGFDKKFIGKFIGTQKQFCRNWLPQPRFYEGAVAKVVQYQDSIVYVEVPYEVAKVETVYMKEPYQVASDHIYGQQYCCCCQQSYYYQPRYCGSCGGGFMWGWSWGWVGIDFRVSFNAGYYDNYCYTCPVYQRPVPTYQQPVSYYYNNQQTTNNYYYNIDNSVHDNVTNSNNTTTTTTTTTTNTTTTTTNTTPITVIPDYYNPVPPIEVVNADPDPVYTGDPDSGPIGPTGVVTSDPDSGPTGPTGGGTEDPNSGGRLANPNGEQAVVTKADFNAIPIASNASSGGTFKPYVAVSNEANGFVAKEQPVTTFGKNGSIRTELPAQVNGSVKQYEVKQEVKTNTAPKYTPPVKYEVKQQEYKPASAPKYTPPVKYEVKQEVKTNTAPKYTPPVKYEVKQQEYKPASAPKYTPPAPKYEPKGNFIQQQMPKVAPRMVSGMGGKKG